VKWISRFLTVAGVILLVVFSYTLFDHARSSSVTLEEAEKVLETNQVEASEKDEFDVMDFNAEEDETFGILNIPKIDRSVGIVEGTDADALKRGVGHISNTVYPGQGEQIVLSGHRDTVFRDFSQLEIGDTFEVEVPYGNFEYEIYDYEIVDRNDTSVIRDMGEEVLVVTTCYPFDFIGYAPDRIAFYAHPAK